MEQEKVISKIQKMMARANDMSGATEHEREVALRMAHTLLVKHNLTMSQTESKKEERTKGYFQWAGSVWSRTIMRSVAELYFCNYFFIRGDKKDSHFFVGLQSNVDVAQEMAKFAVGSVAKESNKVSRGQPHASVYARSFCVGAANAIHDRCYEIRKSAELEHKAGTGLVLASYYRQEILNNEQYLKQVGINLVSKRVRSAPVQTSAYQVGKEYGKTVPINKQVKK